MVSFTVARRTREIGIRVALGVAAGAVLVGALLFAGNGHAPSLVQLASIAAYAAGMLCVCLLACVVPTRRALLVEPTEALRAEG